MLHPSGKLLHGRSAVEEGADELLVVDEREEVAPRFYPQLLWPPQAENSQSALTVDAVQLFFTCSPAEDDCLRIVSRVIAEA